MLSHALEDQNQAGIKAAGKPRLTGRPRINPAALRRQAGKTRSPSSSRWSADAGSPLPSSVSSLLAAVCAYLTLCLLFYQGQWQVVFHPSRTITATPATVGLKYDAISFDYTGAGAAQLTGWWIPAGPGSSPTNAGRTMLFLHDGQGSLSDVTAELKTLHTLGINIFAFDYRGFGQSMNTHPSETRTYEDADAAWNYLTDIRHLDPRSIVLYGTGLGATIAAETAIRHHESPALILENPAPPALSLIAADERTSVLPVRMLFRDRFEIGPKLDSLGVELSQPTHDLVISRQALALARDRPPGKPQPLRTQNSSSSSDQNRRRTRTISPPCMTSSPPFND